MRSARVLNLILVGLLTAALATPALAGRGNGGSGGNGGGSGQAVRAQTQQRLRDGSCQQTQAGVAAQNRVRSRSGGQDGAPVRTRLRDGSALTAPAPVPEAPAE